MGCKLAPRFRYSALIKLFDGINRILLDTHRLAVQRAVPTCAYNVISRRLENRQNWVTAQFVVAVAHGQARRSSVALETDQKDMFIRNRVTCGGDSLTDVVV